MTRETFIHSQVYSQDITTYIYQKIVSLYYLGTITCTQCAIVWFKKNQTFCISILVINMIDKYKLKQFFEKKIFE